MQREDWDRRYAEVENLWAKKPNRFLVAEVEDLPPGRVLDLACGEGQNTIWLASLGWDATGVDYSEVAIAKARPARRERRRTRRLRRAPTSWTTSRLRPSTTSSLVLYLHIPLVERARRPRPRGGRRRRRRDVPLRRTRPEEPDGRCRRAERPDAARHAGRHRCRAFRPRRREGRARPARRQRGVTGRDRYARAGTSADAALSSAGKRSSTQFASSGTRR